eukprot:6463962-Amphidinium_carterae.1
MQRQATMTDMWLLVHQVVMLAHFSGTSLTVEGVSVRRVRVVCELKSTCQAAILACGLLGGSRYLGLCPQDIWG